MNAASEGRDERCMREPSVPVGGARREQAIAPVQPVPPAFREAQSGIRSSDRRDFCGVERTVWVALGCDGGCSRDGGRDDDRSVDSCKPDAHVDVAKARIVGKQVLGSRVAVEVDRRG